MAFSNFRQSAIAQHPSAGISLVKTESNPATAGYALRSACSTAQAVVDPKRKGQMVETKGKRFVHLALYVRSRT